ncbi:MAG TPA: endonuclease/exonuclease/phosphatase family protein [Acidimicrobiales bacterium]|nr:endonuclease/exonuclease/phosphatase family protein [Acidimicrobiales bacterium]
MPLVVTTWNLQGSKGVDADAVAAHVRERETDLLLLQEVQWPQSRRIARALDARSRDWAFKHLSLGTWPEGLAVIGVTRRVRARSTALTRRFEVWNWRRRIMQVVRVGDDLTVVNLHLTAHSGAVEDLERRRELETVATHLPAGGAALVVGDFNAKPGSSIFAPLSGAGLVDSWPSAGGDGFTNWARALHSGPANRRLDYVWTSPAVGIVGARVPVAGDDGYERFGVLSDHLPLTVTLDL